MLAGNLLLGNDRVGGEDGDVFFRIGQVEAVAAQRACIVVHAQRVDDFVRAVWTDRARAAYLLTFGTSFTAALVDVVLGFIIVWVLVRYEFPGRRLVDALIDLPLALPTAVAGLVYSSLYVETGWLGQLLVPLGIHGAYSRFAIVLVLSFIGLPFMVRTVQPVLEDIEKELEEASASLGASRFQTFRRVIFPLLVPAVLSGFALAFARALGEYGSVVFISGNIPMESQITPLLIMSKLESFNYAGATAIAVVMLVASFLLLLVINMLQWWGVRRWALGVGR